MLSTVLGAADTAANMVLSSWMLHSDKSEIDGKRVYNFIQHYVTHHNTV